MNLNLLWLIILLQFLVSIKLQVLNGERLITLLRFSHITAFASSFYLIQKSMQRIASKSSRVFCAAITAWKIFSLLKSSQAMLNDQVAFLGSKAHMCRKKKRNPVPFFLLENRVPTFCLRKRELADGMIQYSCKKEKKEKKENEDY